MFCICRFLITTFFGQAQGLSGQPGCFFFGVPDHVRNQEKNKRWMNDQNSFKKQMGFKRKNKDRGRFQKANCFKEMGFKKVLKHQLMDRDEIHKNHVLRCVLNHKFLDKDGFKKILQNEVELQSIKSFLKDSLHSGWALPLAMDNTGPDLCDRATGLKMKKHKSGNITHGRSKTLFSRKIV